MHGYEPTREAAMQAFARSWHRDNLVGGDHQNPEYRIAKLHHQATVKTSRMEPDSDSLFAGSALKLFRVRFKDRRHAF